MAVWNNEGEICLIELSNNQLATLQAAARRHDHLIVWHPKGIRAGAKVRFNDTLVQLGLAERTKNGHTQLTAAGIMAVTD